MRAADGYGAAGLPPGDPSGTVLGFGRYAGWSLGGIRSRDVDYIEWLDRMPIGRPYCDETTMLLRKTGRWRRSATTDTQRAGSPPLEPVGRRDRGPSGVADVRVPDRAISSRSSPARAA
jgi:hypothetical protein